MSTLTELKCVPCRGGIPPMTDDEIQQIHPQVNQWQVIENDSIKRLQRTFVFKNFMEALQFTVDVGNLAELEDHHPAILTEWGRVSISWWTHKIRGLHQNDFIMAAKSDELYRKKSTLNTK